jgi:hypothetical protein
VAGVVATATVGSQRGFIDFGARCGSLAFPAAPPWPWRVCADLRGYPIPSHVMVGVTTSTTLLTFAVLRERFPARAAFPRRWCRHAGPGSRLLRHQVGQDASLGFQRSPLRRHGCRASSPGWSTSTRSPCLRLGAATLRARSVLAVPPGFDGLLRIGILGVCCTPQPAMGFAAFGASNRNSRKRERPPTPFPATPHPSKLFPRLRPYRITTASTLSTFAAPWCASASCRHVAGAFRASAPTSGSCSAAESVAGEPALPPDRRPMLPWAFIPLVGMTNVPRRSSCEDRLRTSASSLPEGRGGSSVRWGRPTALEHGPFRRASAAALPPSRLVLSSEDDWIRQKNRGGCLLSVKVVFPCRPLSVAPPTEVGDAWSIREREKSSEARLSPLHSDRSSRRRHVETRHGVTFRSAGPSGRRGGHGYRSTRGLTCRLSGVPYGGLPMAGASGWALFLGNVAGPRSVGSGRHLGARAPRSRPSPVGLGLLTSHLRARPLVATETRRTVGVTVWWFALGEPSPWRQGRFGSGPSIGQEPWLRTLPLAKGPFVRAVPGSEPSVRAFTGHQRCVG